MDQNLTKALSDAAGRADGIYIQFEIIMRLEILETGIFIRLSTHCNGKWLGLNRMVSWTEITHGVNAVDILNSNVDRAVYDLHEKKTKIYDANNDPRCNPMGNSSVSYGAHIRGSSVSG